MIEISRALARRLRLVFRKSVPIGTMRGQRSPLSLLAGKDGLLVRSHHPEVMVEFHQPGPSPLAEMGFPGEALDEFEGRGDVSVILEPIGAEAVRARWEDGGVPQVRDYRSPDKEKLPPFPKEPLTLVPIEPGLLKALDEATWFSAQDGSRFSLSKLQLRGRKGEVIATDGKQMLLQKGFTFPWDDDVLIPALGVFGIKELAQEGRLLLGKTDTHLCLRIGPWTFLLLLDGTGRFPDAEAAIPSLKSNVTTCKLSPDDASFMTQALPRLPGKGGDHEPVTLDLNGRVAIRAKGEGQEYATELVLSRSTVSGPSVHVVCNRLFLGRAVLLGFHEFHVAKASAPVVCRDERRTYLWMPLDPAAAIPPGDSDLRISSCGSSFSPPSSPTTSPVTKANPHKERRQVPVPRPEEAGNGHQANGHAENVPGLDELIQEAESLRAALLEVCGRIAQLSSNLKRYRKRGRAVEAAQSAASPPSCHHCLGENRGQTDHPGRGPPDVSYPPRSA